MTVHAVRIKSSKKQEDNPSSVPTPEPPSLPNVLPDRVVNNVKPGFNPVLEEQDQVMNSVGGTTVSAVPEHVNGVYRFSKNDDKQKLLDRIESKVVADAEWYTVATHVCDHDESGDKRTGCSEWIEKRQKGSIPDGLNTKVEATVSETLGFTEGM